MERVKKKKRRIVLWIVLGVIAAVIIAGLAFLLMGQGAIQNMDIQNVPVAGVPDGTYTGSFNGYRWSNTVKVTVSGGKITDIQILKDQAVAIPDLSSKIFASVQEKQSLQVDAVSGSTVSTKAYLKAIQNALEGAK